MLLAYIFPHLIIPAYVLLTRLGTYIYTLGWEVNYFPDLTDQRSNRHIFLSVHLTTSMSSNLADIKREHNTKILDARKQLTAAKTELKRVKGEAKKAIKKAKEEEIKQKTLAKKEAKQKAKQERVEAKAKIKKAKKQVKITKLAAKKEAKSKIKKAKEILKDAKSA